MDVCLGGIDHHVAIIDVVDDEMERKPQCTLHYHQSKGCAARATHQSHPGDERGLSGDLHYPQGYGVHSR